MVESGGHLSGPAADELERRVRGTIEKFAGKLLLTGRQARKLLQNPLLQVYPGRGLHCVFDRTKAHCITATNDDPDLSGCQPDCANIARTGPDIEELRARLARIPDDSLAPPIRHQRRTAIGKDIQSIIETNKEGTPCRPRKRNRSAKPSNAPWTTSWKAACPALSQDSASSNSPALSATGSPTGFSIEACWSTPGRNPVDGLMTCGSHVVTADGGS